MSDVPTQSEPPKAVKVFGDLARPTAIYGLVASIFLALALGRDATILTVLVGGLATVYGAKAVEAAVVGSAQAKATGSQS